MAWTPTYNTINARVIPENLFAFFVANQDDALTWAGDGSLKPIKKFSDSVANRTVSVFPAISFSDDADAQDLAGDTNITGYQVSFELMVTDPSPDEAVRAARVYTKAIVSMIVNCPKATIAANTGATPGATIIEDITVGFDPIRSDEDQVDFMQLVRITPTFRLDGSAFV
jgi:hypothetical protein